MRYELLDELAEINAAHENGEVTPAQEHRGPQLVLLADAAPELLASLRDVLARFRSCIADGNGEIEGDQEAIARAFAAIAKATRGARVTRLESEEIICADEATIRTAFERAIAAGILSEDQNAENAAAQYVFMGTLEEGDAFKHVGTRQYVYNERGAV